MTFGPCEKVALEGPSGHADEKTLVKLIAALSRGCMSRPPQTVGSVDERRIASQPPAGIAWLCLPAAHLRKYVKRHGRPPVIAVARRRQDDTVTGRLSEMPTKDEIYQKVQAALVDALGVDDDEVTPEATLTGDLGAESIDFLDIVFRLEKAFDIKIPRGELFPENLLTDAQYVKDGKLTEAGVGELRRRMPFADIEEFAANPKIQDFGNLFTVQMICGYIESKVNVKA
jgi:acyl carrier protein